MTDAPTQSARVVAVLDMGATAIRLVIAEIAADHRVHTLEEASRGVQMGRDTFSGPGVIHPRTADAAFAALEGFRKIMDGYGVSQVRAVATSAVREARNGDLFLTAFMPAPASPSRSSMRPRRLDCCISRSATP